MAWRLVKQPNGLLALFSDVVDHFTHMDMTPAEAVDVCMNEKQMGALDAIDKVRRGICDEYTGFGDKRPTPVDGLYRWRDCLKTIRLIHGEQEAAAIKAESSP